MAEVATKGQAIVRHRDEGDAIWAVGSLFMVKLAVEESGGPLSVMQVTSLPGGATPLPVHHTEAEAFYLLEGDDDASPAEGEIRYLNVEIASS